MARSPSKGDRPLRAGSAARSFMAGMLAACAYGAWAYLVNREAGPEVAALAAAVQGGYSFLLTLSLTYLLDVLLLRLGRSLRAVVAALTLAVTLLFVVAFVLQWLAATPNIIATILPGWVIGSAYASVYALGFDMLRRSPD